MSANTFFTNPWVKRFSFVLIILAVGLVVSFIAITAQPVVHLASFEPEAGQSTFAGRDLTTLSADDITAYRWQAMAQYYARTPIREMDLTTLSAEDILAYRWQAMAQYYAQVSTNGSDLTTLSSDDITAYRWQAMARYYASHSDIIDSAQR